MPLLSRPPAVLLVVAILCLSAGCSGLQRSAFSVQLSAFSVQRSAFSLQGTGKEPVAAEDEDTGGFWAAVGGYFKHRGLDFLDTFDVGVSAGRWARVEAQYGIGLWGLGDTVCRRARLGQRSALLEEESQTQAPLPLPVSLLLYPFGVGDDIAELSWLLTGCREIEEPTWPAPGAMEIPLRLNRSRLAFWGGTWGESFTVGLDAHLLIGVRARVRPVQVLDFLTGIFGWDLAADDKPRVWL